MFLMHSYDDSSPQKLNKTSTGHIYSVRWRDKEKLNINIALNRHIIVYIENIVWT